jgi:hypothetical protein
MKAITGVFVVLLAALPGWAQAQDPAKTKEGSDPNYYPLKKGSKWHYQVDTGTGQKVPIINQIAKEENIDGQKMFRLETLVNNNVQATEHLTANKNGVFRNRYNGVEVSPPVCLLQYPIKENATWKSETKVGDQTLIVSGREGKIEEVKVPGGTFQAVTAVVETTVNGMKISTSYWFAPRVGIVKQTLDLAGKTINMELTKYEEGR